MTPALVATFGRRTGARVLTAALIAVLLALAFAPFLFPGARALAAAAQICVFIALAASYDILLGYAGIVSFAHAMFFGVGAYGAALALANYGPHWGALGGGVALALATSLSLAFAIGMLSLRVRAIFFAMITLAAASFAAILVSQLHNITGGEDGLTYRVPRVFSPAFKLADEKVFGVSLNGRIVAYYAVFAGSLTMFLVMLRIVSSPFGRTLRAIRENEFRAEAVGYPVALFRASAFCVSAGFATLAGALNAVWLKYVGPGAVLSLEVMLDILLMTVIGGMGTLYGAVIGATVFILARFYLRDLMQAASDATADIPVLSDALHPDRWLLWLGLLFILCVYFFPEGIVGRLRRRDGRESG